MCIRDRRYSVCSLSVDSFSVDTRFINKGRRVRDERKTAILSWTTSTINKWRQLLGVHNAMRFHLRKNSESFPPSNINLFSVSAQLHSLSNSFPSTELKQNSGHWRTDASRFFAGVWAFLRRTRTRFATFRPKWPREKSSFERRNRNNQTITLCSLSTRKIKMAKHYLIRSILILTAEEGGSGSAKTGPNSLVKSCCP